MRRPHLTFCYIIGIYGKTREVVFSDYKTREVVFSDYKTREVVFFDYKKRRSLILIQWKKG